MRRLHSAWRRAHLVRVIGLAAALVLAVAAVRARLAAIPVPPSDGPLARPASDGALGDPDRDAEATDPAADPDTDCAADPDPDRAADPAADCAADPDPDRAADPDPDRAADPDAARDAGPAAGLDPALDAGPDAARDAGPDADRGDPGARPDSEGRDTLDARAARRVLERLDAARAAGFAEPAAADVADWALRTCPCAVGDAAALRRLAASGHALRAARLVVVSVAVVSAGAGWVTIVVTDRLPAYEEVDSAGRVTRRWPGRGLRRWHVTLALTRAGWRTAGIVARESTRGAATASGRGPPAVRVARCSESGALRCRRPGGAADVRAIWKGAISFGLVSIPVRLYSATDERDIAFRQVHRDDGGRIRYQRVCTTCGAEVAYADIAKGYEMPDGSVVVLTDEDLESLPLATSRMIDVVQFVPLEQIDPIYFARSYYLEPEKAGLKPYVLLARALEESGKVAVVKVALRQREALAALRVRDGVFVLETMLWPDEIRAAEFDVLDAAPEIRPQELAMAGSLIESLSGDFEPTQFTDAYRGALEDLIAAKVEGQELVAPIAPAADGGAVVDLMAALRASVEAARAGKLGGAGESGAGEATAGDRADAAGGARPKRLPRKSAATATPRAATPRAAAQPAAGAAAKRSTAGTAKPPAAAKSSGRGAAKPAAKDAKRAAPGSTPAKPAKTTKARRSA